ncbi:MAG: cbb3-type cytochrome c oxidase subunit I [Candidatus Nitrosocosmicus sp.]|nr:cbb3-type cytochrome c oxidase subunit I [Candidatus Nitrosocosmicus sp.]
MQDHKYDKKYDTEQGPSSGFEISQDLQNLTKKFIIAALIYFLIAGSLAIVMRLIQSHVMILGDQNPTHGLFYASLTIHGQLMFFGVASMLVIGISYYLLSKFAKKSLYSFTLAILSFSLLNAGSIMLIISGTLFFGAGWYNLMPLPFLPGNNGWNTLSVSVFLIAELLIGLALTVFCLNVIMTALRGKIAVGIQKTEISYDEPSSINLKDSNNDNKRNRSKSDEGDKGNIDFYEVKSIPASLRWINLLGIGSWFPVRYRVKIPAVSIVVVGIFVNALVQLIGNIGLFAQLATGFTYLVNPDMEPNWLLTKDLWWFFGHPIVYFTLFSFLGAAYYYIPRYTKKTVPYDKWAYRSWPFYFAFTMLVFSHHVFADMPNPAWLQMIAQTASFGIAFPSGLTIMTVLMYIFRSRIRWNITTMFMMAGLAGWAFGGFAGMETGWWGTDLYLHNTLNIVGHIHLVILMGSLLFAFGLIYSILPDLTKKNSMSRILGLLHLLPTLIGGFGLAFIFLFLGFEGAIRREAMLSSDFDWALPLMLFFALTIGLGQIIFVYNVFKTLLKRDNKAISSSSQKPLNDQKKLHEN